MNTVDLPALLKDVLPLDVVVSAVVYKTDKLFVNSQLKTLLTNVLSLSVSGIEAGQVIDPPISVSMQVTANVSAGMQYYCVYYDFATLSWVRSGLAVSNVSLHDDGNVTVSCNCRHLTNFAVLLDHSDNSQSLSSANAVALNYITLVGCSISIVLMGLVVIAVASSAVCWLTKVS